MGAHMAVENHSEVIGSLCSTRATSLFPLGSINTNFEKASETIEVDVDIVPYMIDNIDDKVKTAVSAVGGGIWSRREGIMFARNVDRIDEELKEIEEERQAEQVRIGEKDQKKED